MRSLLAAAFVVLPSFAALAETLSGQLSDPALRRKTQLVYVEKVDGKFTAPSTPAVMNQAGNKYVPALLPILAGQKVVFQSEDPELHNVFAREGKTTLFNRAVLTGQKFERQFDEVGIVHLACNIHKEMSADIIVLQNPYFAKPDKTGKFVIDGIPAGTYTLRVWGAELSAEQKEKKFQVTVTAGQTTLKLAAR